MRRPSPGLEPLALLAVALGCSPHEPGPPSSAPSTGALPREAQPAPPASASSASEAAALAPLRAEDAILDLPVPGHGAAMVAVPLGATSPRPVAIVTHGTNDGPQWQCPLFRGVIGGGVFILCPRGVRRRDQPPSLPPGETRFTYASAEALAAEVDAGIAALRARFRDHVDPGPALYAGFSLGANMGVALAVARPSRATRLILTEGGHTRWTPATARAFAAGGGERVLFACGLPGCVPEAKAKATLLEAAGVATKVVYGAGVGHGMHGAVADETRASLPWLLEGDARWEAR